MKTINIREAQTRLCDLVERAQRGEEIVISKAGRPVARLVAIEHAPHPIRVGGLEGTVPDDFNIMLEEDVAALFAAHAEPGSYRKG